MPYDSRESEDDFGQAKGEGERDLRNELALAMYRVRTLESAIRTHRDQRGDNRCWLDDRDLYSILPEGYTPLKEDSSVELERCKAFIKLRHDPATSYISPQEMIDKLTRQLEEMRLFYREREDRFITSWEQLKTILQAAIQGLVGKFDEIRRCPNAYDMDVLQLQFQVLLADFQNTLKKVWEDDTLGRPRTTQAQSGQPPHQEGTGGGSVQTTPKTDS